MDDEIERELLKIEAMADVLVTVQAAEFEKNTLTSMAVIILRSLREDKGVYIREAEIKKGV